MPNSGGDEGNYVEIADLNDHIAIRDSKTPTPDTSQSPTETRRILSGAGPAGTVIAFESGTLHRGTQVTAPRGARYSVHLGFRPSSLQWGQRTG